jgi:hypothetical protein
MRKGDKAGQFYLIAAIIIAGLVIGFAVINNSSSNKSPVELKEMVEELQIEGEQVLNYDLVHSTNQFEEFSNDYSAYAGEDKEIYFIVGDDSAGFHAYRYTGGDKTDLDSDLTIGSNIAFNLYGISYEFKKEKGENFYFILNKKIEDENYVLAG